jgi:hypothetical protein
MKTMKKLRIIFQRDESLMIRRDLTNAGFQSTLLAWQKYQIKKIKIRTCPNIP